MQRIPITEVIVIVIVLLGGKAFVLIIKVEIGKTVYKHYLTFEILNN